MRQGPNVPELTGAEGLIPMATPRPMLVGARARRQGQPVEEMGQGPRP